MDYSKPETISLNDLLARIKSTDLIPSRAVLLEEIDGKFERLSQKGIRTWLDLSKAIKSPKNMEALSKEVGIDLQYLVLLRREIESYHPKPLNLKEIDWVAQETIKRLLDEGITSSDRLLSVCDSENLISFAERIGLDVETMTYIFDLCRLTRVQWVSPTTARMLIEAGYDSCQKLSAADGTELFEAMDRVNKSGKYFKGTIGLRDIKRLIEAAQYAV